jgi:hypothetical protein
MGASNRTDLDTSLTASKPPAIGAVALFLFLWILPFHSLVIAVLFGAIGVSAQAARIIAAWKEVAIAALLLWTLLRSLSKTGPSLRISPADVGVTGLIATALVFILLESTLFRANIPRGAQLFGLRDTVFFAVLYYVGRGIPEIADSDAFMRNAFRITLVISAIGVLERIYVTPQMLVFIGAASYQSDFLGLGTYTTGNEYGLPLNYWTWMGGVPVRRAGSVFLHSQGFALPFLLLMPTATAWVFNPDRRHAFLTRLGYGLAWGGLLLTITRMTTLVCLIQVIMMFLILRRPELALGALLMAAAVVLAAMVARPGILHFAWETLTFQSASSESHTRDWAAGLVAFFEQPWGHGLGTTDAAATRFSQTPLTSDNMYLSYAVQLGVVGIVSLLVALGSILVSAWRTAWSGTTETQRRFGAIMALTTFGILVNGMTSTVFSSNMLADLYFLLAGALVTRGGRAA